jgi:hypothetical protein
MSAPKKYFAFHCQDSWSGVKYKFVLSGPNQSDAIGKDRRASAHYSQHGVCITEHANRTDAVNARSRIA